MGIRYTQKTREVLGFICDYGFISTKVCSKVFYKDNKNGYTQARVILNKLFKNGDLKRYEHESTKEWIYQINKKVVDPHRKAMIDLYSEIFMLVDSIEYFKVEATWCISNRRSDAHIIYKKNGRVNSLLVEYERYHSTSQKKLDEIYASEEVQEFYKLKYKVEDYFPNVLVISPLATTKLVSDKISIVCIAYNFEGLGEII